MRPWRLVLLALLAAAAAATVAYWPWIDAQRRAAIVLAEASPTPVVSWIIRTATDDPRTEEAVVAGFPTTILSAGGSRRPAVVLLPGTVTAGRLASGVDRMARALARAGYLVLVPELPGLADGEITPAAVRGAVAVGLEATGRRDVKGGRIAFAGAWAAAAIGILAAEDPSLAPRVGAVIGIAPYAAAPNMLRLATTGFTLDRGELKAYSSDSRQTLTAARSLVAALRAGSDRAQLLELLRGVDPRDPDPLRVVRGLATSTLRPDAAAVVRLLANRHPTVFDGLYAALPPYLRTTVESLSPLLRAGGLEAKLELATSPRDRYVPPAESEALARTASRAHLSRTGAVGDGLPDPSFVETFSADEFLVRAVRAAG